MTNQISRDELRGAIADKLSAHFGVTAENATDEQVFQAAAIVIREILSRLHTFDSRTAPEREVHYLSMDPDLVRRMIDEGHVLGNHSVTHPSAGMPSLSLDKQENEVTENHAYIKENFGYDMYLFRYPTGRFSEQSLALLNNCNYKSIFWSFAYLDYDVNNQPDHASSLQKMKDKLHPGAIYLLHAESETNAAVLGDFIDAVRAAGYGFKNF